MDVSNCNGKKKKKKKITQRTLLIILSRKGRRERESVKERERTRKREGKREGGRKRERNSLGWISSDCKYERACSLIRSLETANNYQHYTEYKKCESVQI